MFDNVGDKIQSWAKGIFTLNILLSIAGAVIVIVFHPFGYRRVDPLDVLLGVGVFIVGFLYSWFVSLVVYGFGELIVNSKK